MAFRFGPRFVKASFLSMPKMRRNINIAFPTFQILPGIMYRRTFVSVESNHDHVEHRPMSTHSVNIEKKAKEAQIIELIENSVRPHAKADGGDVIFLRMDHDTGVVHVTMHGCVNL
jgi:hypothetical protein